MRARSSSPRPYAAGCRRREPGSTVDVGADQRYFLRILGDPAGFEPWAWRINGHHLALHVTMVDGAIGFTPQFFGAEPAKVLSGPHAGLRTLPTEQDLGFELLNALEPGQRSLAIVADVRHPTTSSPATTRSPTPASCTAASRTAN